MAKIKSLIPNLLTAGNLTGGILAILFSLTGRLEWAPYCIFISAFLDFFDGFVARLLKVQGELGKQLDSLADMVTFGVAPGVMVFVMMDMPNILVHDSFFLNHLPVLDIFGISYYVNDTIVGVEIIQQIGGEPALDPFPVLPTREITSDLLFRSMPLVALLIPVFAMFRLAKFNLDTRQSDSFIGVPTPAMTLYFASIPLILLNAKPNSSSIIKEVSVFLINPWFLLVSTLVFSYLMVAELPLFALKFKSFGWKGNEIRYSFLTLSVALLATLHFLALPILIILYILLSILQNIIKK